MWHWTFWEDTPAKVYHWFVADHGLLYLKLHVARVNINHDLYYVYEI